MSSGRGGAKKSSAWSSRFLGGRYSVLWLTSVTAALSFVTALIAMCQPSFAAIVQESLSSLGLRGTSRMISPAIYDHVQQAIRVALESTVQPRDFALASEGAQVVSALTSQVDFIEGGSQNLPENVLTEGLHLESCWIFPSPQMQIGIRFREHHFMPTHIALDMGISSGFRAIMQAPRHVVLWGLVDGNAKRLAYEGKLSEYRKSVARLGTGPAESLGYTFLALAEFEFDPYAAFPLQTFPVADAIVDAQMTFGVLVLEVRSNWGGRTTTICRVRALGDIRVV
ncbi:hypothetical protein BC628DRAFT_1418233 [Trametes gibbosa]|nr:hypothetical protein BC628DRAFT_1418233 [Trametes gibbosa]